MSKFEYKKFGQEIKEQEQKEHLSRFQQSHRANYTSKQCEICGYSGFQPYKDKILCYECYEKAWGSEGCEPYDRDKFKAKLETIKDTRLIRYILNVIKNLRLNNE